MSKKKVFLDPNSGNFFKNVLKIETVTSDMVSGLSGKDMLLVLRYFQKHLPLKPIEFTDLDFFIKNRPAIFYVLRAQKQPDLISKALLSEKDALFGGLEPHMIYLIAEGKRYPAWHLVLLFLLESVKIQYGFANSLGSLIGKDFDNLFQIMLPEGSQFYALFNLLDDYPPEVQLRALNYMHILELRSFAMVIFHHQLQRGKFSEFHLLQALDYACVSFKNLIKG